MTTRTEIEQPTFNGFEEWGSRSLAGSFIVPPFDNLSAQRGDWQARKRLWVDILGLRDTTALGRAQNLVSGDGNVVRQPQFYRQKTEWEKANGRQISTAEFAPYYVPPKNARVTGTTSEFDPALCEVMYTWYTAPGWRVFDPFAGDVERGLVATYLERQYSGIEVRREQVEANTGLAEALAERLGITNMSEWIEGDSSNAKAIMEGLGRPMADFLFTCPPYWDLEVYSDDPRDLSTMSLEGFTAAIDGIIGQSLSLLRPNRFAVVVMGDKRDKHGHWAHLPARTTEAFERHGAYLHNDIIFLTSLGSKPQFARHAFELRRTLQPIYEHALVYIKGSTKEAVAALGEVAITDGNSFISSSGQYPMFLG